jgi:transketolase
MSGDDPREQLADQLRVDAVRAAGSAESGHPTSGMSAAELMAVLFDGYLRYDFTAPGDANNDSLLFSKGHATPLLYSLYKAAGAITEDELLTYRQQGSRLEGHPTPLCEWVEVATGSLGQGLPIGVGVALAARSLDRLPYHTWVLCGDSEMAEGSIWEAVEHAAFAGLDNLTAVLDVNRLGQRGETRHGWDVSAYTNRLRAFGWEALEVDGHDVGAIDEAYRTASTTEGRPTAIVARTIKGRGVAEVEDEDDRHGKPMPAMAEAVAELGGDRGRTVSVAKPATGGKPHEFPTGSQQLPTYPVGGEAATRHAYGAGLAALGTTRGDVVALDAEVSNSTGAALFRQTHPERFFEMYIAEQQMVAAAVGMQARGWMPFASSFAAFLARSYDFVRMAAVGRADLCLVGSHAGVSIGRDGPSQMGLEDLAAFRAVHGSAVVYPCDANQTAALVPLLAERGGISYLRTTRPKTRVIYDEHDRFAIGGSRVVRASDDDEVTIVAAGLAVQEALEAADSLAEAGVQARVVDCYSVKPIDALTLHEAAEATGGRLVTVEDHWAEGGLGDAVLEAFGDSDACPRVVKLAVRHMPGSASPDQQLAAAGIDAAAIERAATTLVGR